MIILFRMTDPDSLSDKVYMCRKAQVIAKTSGRMLWQIEFGDRIHKIFIDDLVGVFDDIESLCKFRATHKIRMHRFFESNVRDAEINDDAWNGEHGAAAKTFYDMVMAAREQQKDDNISPRDRLQMIRDG